MPPYGRSALLRCAETGHVTLWLTKATVAQQRACSHTSWEPCLQGDVAAAAQAAAGPEVVEQAQPYAWLRSLGGDA